MLILHVQFPIMIKIKEISSTDVYFAGLCLMAISLPVSVFGMSVSQFIIGINWLISGKFSAKWNRIKQSRELKVFLLLYLIHIVGLIYTHWPQGFIGPQHNALDELRIKLPLFLFPVIILSSESLEFNKIRIIIMMFAASVIFSSFLSILALLQFIPIEINDPRDLSLFISHIRFALLVNFSVFALAYLFYRRFNQLSISSKLAYAFAILWLSVFLFILKALTGIVIFGLVNLILLFAFIWRKKNVYSRSAATILLIGIVSFVLYTGKQLLDPFIHVDKIDVSDLPPFSENGNKYYHFTENPLTENGHWVGLYVCPEELRSLWNKRSSIPYDSLDHKGQTLRFTLWRYLTSLNLKKDSTGMMQLDDVDIHLIEDGYSNYIFKKKFSIYPRLYQTVWEIDLYLRTGNPTGQSVSQRIEYLKAAREIINRNMLIGVGTGDVQQEFDQEYIRMNTKLSAANRHRAHNQFVTFAIQFGFLGLLMIIFAIFYPVSRIANGNSFLFVLYFIIVLVSMINEDTLETQAGVTFFIFFYSLFLFGSKTDLVLRP